MNSVKLKLYQKVNLYNNAWGIFIFGLLHIYIFDYKVLMSYSLVINDTW